MPGCAENQTNMKKLLLLVMMIIFAAVACKQKTCTSKEERVPPHALAESSLIFHDQEWRNAGRMSIALEETLMSGPKRPALDQMYTLSEKYLDLQKVPDKYVPEDLRKTLSADQVRQSQRSGDEIIYVENGQVFYVYEKVK